MASVLRSSATLEGEIRRHGGMEGRRRERRKSWLTDPWQIAHGQEREMDVKEGDQQEEGEILQPHVDEMDLGEKEWNVSTPEIAGNGECGSEGKRPS